MHAYRTGTNKDELGLSQNTTVDLTILNEAKCAELLSRPGKSNNVLCAAKKNQIERPRVFRLLSNSSFKPMEPEPGD